MSTSVVHVERLPLLEVQIEESQPEEIEENHHKGKGFIVCVYLQSNKDSRRETLLVDQWQDLSSMVVEDEKGASGPGAFESIILAYLKRQGS